MDIDTEILTGIRHGGTEPANDLIDDDERIDPALLKSIGALVAGGASADKIAAALDAPATRISSFLRRNRRRIALILTAGVGDKLVVTTGRYYKLLSRVLDEIESRIETCPEGFNTNQLMKLADVAAKWLGPVNRHVILDASDDKHALPPVVAPVMTIELLSQMSAAAAQVRAQQAMEMDATDAEETSAVINPSPPTTSA